MSEADDKFVHYRNIDRFRRQLQGKGVLTDVQRSLVEQLLADEVGRGDEAGWPRTTLGGAS